MEILGVSLGVDPQNHKNTEIEPENFLGKWELFWILHIIDIVDRYKYGKFRRDLTASFREMRVRTFGLWTNIALFYHVCRAIFRPSIEIFLYCFLRSIGNVYLYKCSKL